MLLFYCCCQHSGDSYTVTTHFIFTIIGKYYEFMGIAPSDEAGICFYHPVTEANSLQNPAVCVMHLFINNLQVIIGSATAVRILHDKFPCSKQSIPRPYFISEFDLYLI